MAQLVHNYLDEIDGPEGYLIGLGEAFLNEHLDEIKQGAIEGKKFAENVLKKS